MTKNLPIFDIYHLQTLDSKRFAVIQSMIDNHFVIDFRDTEFLSDETAQKVESLFLTAYELDGTVAVLNPTTCFQTLLADNPALGKSLIFPDDETDALTKLYYIDNA